MSLCDEDIRSAYCTYLLAAHNNVLSFAPTCGPGGSGSVPVFASGGAAQSGTGPAKVVRRHVVHARLSGELLNNVPGKLLSHAFAPSLASAADATEDLSRFDCRSVDPRAEFAINPVRNRDSPYVAAFAAQVYDRQCPSRCWN